MGCKRYWLQRRTSFKFYHVYNFSCWILLRCQELGYCLSENRVSEVCRVPAWVLQKVIWKVLQPNSFVRMNSELKESVLPFSNIVGTSWYHMDDNAMTGQAARRNARCLMDLDLWRPGTARCQHRKFFISISIRGHWEDQILKFPLGREPKRTWTCLMSWCGVCMWRAISVSKQHMLDQKT